MAPKPNLYQRADGQRPLGLFDDPVFDEHGQPVLVETREGPKLKTVRKPLQERKRIMGRLVKEVMRRDFARDCEGDVPEDELKTRVEIGREDEDRAREYTKKGKKKASASTSKGKKKYTKPSTGKRKRVDKDKDNAGKSKPSPQPTSVPSSPLSSPSSPLPPSKKRKPNHLTVRIKIIPDSALQGLLQRQTRIFYLPRTTTRNELIEKLNAEIVGDGYTVEDLPPPDQGGQRWGWDIVVPEPERGAGDVWMDDGITLGDLAGQGKEDRVLVLRGTIAPM